MVRLSIRLLVPTLLLVVAVAGCCSTYRVKPRTYAVRDNHSLFNPYWVPGSAGINDRRPWPCAARTDGAEEIYYVDRLVDVQGRGHHDEDYLRARFTQVRTGTARP